MLSATTRPGGAAEEVESDFVEGLALAEEALRGGEGAAEEGLETWIVGEGVFAAVGCWLGKSPEPAEIFGFGGAVKGDLRRMDLAGDAERREHASEEEDGAGGEMERKAHET